jgi:hypothetical protein
MVHLICHESVDHEGTMILLIAHFKIASKHSSKEGALDVLSAHFRKMQANTLTRKQREGAPVYLVRNKDNLTPKKHLHKQRREERSEKLHQILLERKTSL